MKDKTINCKAFFIEFTRDYAAKVNVKVTADSPKGTRLIIKTKLDFDCIPHIIVKLRKQWAEEKQNRLQRMQSVSNHLGE